MVGKILGEHTKYSYQSVTGYTQIPYCMSLDLGNTQRPGKNMLSPHRKMIDTMCSKRAPLYVST